MGWKAPNREAGLLDRGATSGLAWKAVDRSAGILFVPVFYVLPRRIHDRWF